MVGFPKVSAGKGKAAYAFLSALLAALVVAGPSAAQTSTGPQHFGKWTVQCVAGDQGPPCEATAAVTLRGEEGTGPAVAGLLAIARTVPDGEWLVAMRLPISALLLPGATLHADDGPPIVQAPFSACRPESCIANTMASPQQMEVLAGAQETIFVAYTAQDLRPIRVALPVEGLLESLAVINEALNGTP